MNRVIDDDGFLAHVWRHRWVGAGVAVAVMILLAVWLESRDEYHVFARIELGGFAKLSKNSSPDFELLEPLEEVERFALNEAKTGARNSLASKCVVEAVTLIVPALDVTCAGKDPKEAQERLMVLARPVLDRHQRFYALEMSVAQRYTSERLEKLNRLDARINALRKQAGGRDPLTFLLQDRQAELEERKASLLNDQRMDEFRRRYHRMTALGEVQLVDRTFGKSIWFVLAGISVLSGGLATVLLGLGTILSEQQQNA